MKLYFILTAFILLSCQKKDEDTFGSYPKGVMEGDLVTLNDCTLPLCSEERVVRLFAKDVKATIYLDTLSNLYVAGYRYNFDSYLNLFFCNVPAEFRVHGLEIIFDGELVDPCGYFQPIFPVEEIYIVRVSKMEKL